MAFCKNCGAEVGNNQDVCLKCGVNLDQTPEPTVVDNGGFGWGLLGFCIPLVGLILYIVWKQERPLSAKAAGVGALIGVIVNIVVGIIYGIIVAGLMTTL